MILYHFTWLSYLPSILEHGLDTGEVIIDDTGAVAEQCPWFTSRAAWDGHSWSGSDGSSGYDPEMLLPIRLTVDVPRDRLVNAGSHFRKLPRITAALGPRWQEAYRPHAGQHWFHAGPVAPRRIKAVHLWVDPATNQPAYAHTPGRFVAKVGNVAAVAATIAVGAAHHNVPARGPGFGNFSSDLLREED